MNEQEYSVMFQDAEVGNLTDISVTREQAQDILAAGLGETVRLDARRWVRLQPGADAEAGRRVYYYHHGQSGGYGYTIAREQALKEALRAILRGDGDA